MKARLVCKTCGGARLLLERTEDDKPLVVPCPNCGAGAEPGEAERGRYRRRPGYRCIRLPFKDTKLTPRDMKYISWCGRDTREEKVFWTIDHAAIEAVTCTGEVACGQCIDAIRATMRKRE